MRQKIKVAREIKNRQAPRGLVEKKRGLLDAEEGHWKLKFNCKKEMN